MKRPVSVTMLSICIVALGVIAWYKMPLKFLPRVDRPVIGCYIPYPNSTPEQIEQQITIPVEGEFRTIPGMRKMWSWSYGDGCRINMRFNLDVNMTLATAEVRDRIERLKLKLPKEVDRIFVERFSSGSLPVMAFGFFQEGDQEDFAHQVRTVIEPRLRRLGGVADVQLRSPIPEKEVVIEFEQASLRSMNLALTTVVGALQQSSLNLSVGTLNDAESKYYVRTLGEYRRIEDISNLVVLPNGTRLKDIATVRYATRDEGVHVALDGKGGVVILVIKESEANTVETCENVHAELAKICSEPDFANAATKIFFDQSDLIQRALRNLFLEGIFGGFWAIVILFIFLHRIGPTIIVSLAIPTSIVIALVYMYFVGMSLNIISMVSLIISVGMLVDNAIVVVENIIRHRQLGASLSESARLGASEVGMAIFGSTATTAVVFAPMFYLETGRMSVFMEQLGQPLIVALTGSLVVALTVVPLAMSLIPDTRHVNAFDAASVRIERWTGGRMRFLRRTLDLLSGIHGIQRIIDAYSWCLAWTLRHRLAAFAIMAAFLYLTYAIPFKNVGMRDMPKLDTREIAVQVELDQNFDMVMARNLFQELQDKIELQRQELAIKNILCFHGRSGGTIEVYLYTEDDGPIGLNPPYDTEAAMRFLRDYLPERVPGAEIKMNVADTGESESSSTVSVSLRGDEADVLGERADRFMELMRGMPALSDVKSDLEKGSKEMRISIDAPKADNAGVTPMIVGSTVEAALRGARMPYMKQGGREIPVWTQFREEDRKSKDNLENVAVTNVEGQLTPLNQLIEYELEPSPKSIRRVDGKNVILLTAKAETDDLTLIQRDLKRAMGDFYLPQGYTVQFGEDLEEIGENVFNFTSMMIMAVILVYIVMCACFESLLLPLSILTTVPLSLAGSAWVLYATKTQFDTVTLIGNILMVGVIVNNGIVIIDHINKLRKEGLVEDLGEHLGISGGGFFARLRAGMSPMQLAIIQAGRDRFRPVMMTALTTILGLVPLAMAKTGGAATFAGLGRALIGGLTLGTLLTLVVVPLFYTFLDDIQRWTSDFLGGFRRRR